MGDERGKKSVREQLSSEEYGFIGDEGREFAAGWDEAMRKLGYDCGNAIGDGYCWGRYMLIYRRTGAKSAKVYCRLYLRDGGAALRLFLSDVDAHTDWIERSPGHVQEAFINGHGLCGHCHNERNGACRHRKAYTLHGRRYEKCDGYTFEYSAPKREQIPDYLGLLGEFYPRGGRGRRSGL